MLKLCTVYKFFDDVRVLNGVNLCLAEGRIHPLNNKERVKGEALCWN